MPKVKAARPRVRAARTSARSEGDKIAKCEVCGNEYYLSFEVVTAGVRHTFDSFECVIHKLAPVCDHCGSKIIDTASRRKAPSTAAPTARARSG
jgi:hypothetical protein